MFQTIRKYYPEFKSQELRREKVWEVIFPEKPFNYGVIKNLIHELSKLADKFMELQTYESDKPGMDFNLLSNILKRPVEKVFNVKLNQVSAYIEKEKKSYPDYFKYTKKLKLLRFESHGNKVSHIKKDEKEISIDISENELYYSICRLIKTYCYMKGFIYRSNFKKDILKIEIFLDGIDFNKLNDNIKKLSHDNYIILDLYFRMYTAMRYNDNFDNYLSFKECLIKNFKYFHKKEKSLLFNILESSLTINTAKFISYREYYEIDMLRFGNNLLLDENNLISFNEFAGIIKTSSSLKEIKFLEEFINNYRKHVNKPQQFAAEEFASAYLHYTRGDLKASLDIITRSGSNYFEFRVDMKILQIKIFYELEDFVSLEYKIDAMKHYLNSEKVNSLYKSHFIQFCNYVIRLYKLKETGNEKDVLYFKDEIRNADIVSSYWMNEKVDELIKKIM
ncbi:MAG: hypothetical protein JSS91_06295 [Bacteroidetes bacterium]|nr:hypothetical protein [Bacteroidota bacterium]